MLRLILRAEKLCTAKTVYTYISESTLILQASTIHITDHLVERVGIFISFLYLL